MRLVGLFSTDGAGGRPTFPAADASHPARVRTGHESVVLWGAMEGQRDGMVASRMHRRLGSCRQASQGWRRRWCRGLKHWRGPFPGWRHRDSGDTLGFCLYMPGTPPYLIPDGNPTSRPAPPHPHGARKEVRYRIHVAQASKYSRGEPRDPDGGWVSSTSQQECGVCTLTSRCVLPRPRPLGHASRADRTTSERQCVVCSVCFLVSRCVVRALRRVASHLPATTGCRLCRWPTLLGAGATRQEDSGGP